MSANKTEFTNPIILFVSFAFISYLVYWVFVDNYIKGEEIGKYNPHEEVVDMADSKEEVENKYNLTIATDASISHGKSQYVIYCATCHGDSGLGDGPGSNSVPPPRNFTEADKFKYGVTYENLLSTIKNGSPGTSMAPFDYLSDDDKTGIIHYISEWIPGRTMADIGTTGGSVDGGSDRVAAISAPVSLEVVVLTDKQIDKTIKSNALVLSEIVNEKMTTTAEDKIIALLAGNSNQVSVGPYSQLYVPGLADKSKAMASLAQFVEFINSDYVFEKTRMSFGTLTSNEARQMFDSVKSKLN